MAKTLDLQVLGLPYSNRIARKAEPTGCAKAWWYLETNGGITIYGTNYDGKPFSCAISARGLKVISRRVRGGTTNG